MKQLQRLALISLVLTLAALTGASTAAATALEIGGVGRAGAVTLEATIESGTSAILTDTGGTPLNTCTSSVVEGKSTSPFSATQVVGDIETLSFTNCTHSPIVVHKKGTLSVERIGTTTNGTLRSNGAEVTVPVGFGGTTVATCKTSNTDIGTLTGVKAGRATIDINAVLNCGFLLPSVLWKATYTVTSPEGLGVVESAAPAPTTTLEVGGTAMNEAVTVNASLKSGTSALLTDTNKSFANTCTGSTGEGKTVSPYSGTVVSGPISTLSFSKCTHEPVVVNSPGSLSVEWIKGTTNGTVRSTGASVTVPVGLFGGTTNVTCTTNNTDLGTLTGVKAGSATIDIKAVLGCGFLLPSGLWDATYTVTSPEGLGVTS